MEIRGSKQSSCSAASEVGAVPTHAWSTFGSIAANHRHHFTTATAASTATVSTTAIQGRWATY